VDDTVLFGQPDGIMRVPASGGSPELMIAAKGGEHLDSPQLLPDGDSVLFSVVGAAATGDPSPGDVAQVVVQSLRSGERKVLVPFGSDARYVPTGHLVYALDDGLLAVRFDADTLEVSGRAASLIQGVLRPTASSRASATANYSVSRDGTLFYVTTGVVASRLTWVQRDGTDEPITTIPPNVFGTPRLSSDDRRALVGRIGL
jgi:hypothetical protein